MADFYIISRVTANGGKKYDVFDATQLSSAQVKTLQAQLHAEGGVATTVYREVTETVANQVILKR